MKESENSTCKTGNNLNGCSAVCGTVAVNFYTSSINNLTNVNTGLIQTANNGILYVNIVKGYYRIPLSLCYKNSRHCNVVKTKNRVINGDILNGNIITVGITDHTGAVSSVYTA